MLKKPSIFILLSVTFTIMTSCEKENSTPEDRGYLNGVIISCEGTFNSNNGSISWYDTDSAKIINNLFEMVNGRPAGDVIQSFSAAGDYGVIVANNSQKIEIINLRTFESAGTITGFSYPRNFVYSGNGEGWLSNGSMNGKVYRIDLSEGTVTDSVEVGFGPEQLLISGHYLYVANSGGFTVDNTISVIDTRTAEITGTIIAGDGPVAMVPDVNNNIWVLCKGKIVYDETWTEIIEETDSRLVRINQDSGEVDREVIIGTTGDYFNPGWLSINPAGNILYFGEIGGLYAMGIEETVQPAEPVIAQKFSAAAIDPRSGNLYALKITDYTSPGMLHIYEGENEVVTFETGIAPGGLVFLSEGF